jgi:prepilin-type N-terminal cleavage/methylation domain-containing protein
MRNVMLRTPHSALRTLRSRGFTLLELLVVVTIMIFITLIVVLNYFGGTRSAGYAAANRNVFDALMLARQRACMDGCRTFLCLLDSTNYVIVRSIGTISDVKPSDSVGQLHDYYSDLAAYAGATNGIMLVNMTRPSVTGTLKNATCQSSLITNYYDYFGNFNADISKIAVTTPNIADWHPGDTYGIELHTRQALPAGFYFCDVDDTGKPQGSPPTHVTYAEVRFRPDGTLDSNSSPQWLCAVEEVSTRNMSKFSLTNCVRFKIESNGRISAPGGAGE